MQFQPEAPIYEVAPRPRPQSHLKTGAITPASAVDARKGWRELYFIGSVTTKATMNSISLAGEKNE